MSAIELLTVGDDGHAVEGPQFPDDIGSTAQYDSAPPEGDYQLAYRCKFFRRNEHGQPMPETLVAFLVPSRLLDANGLPSERALALVSERMGWQ